MPKGSNLIQVQNNLLLIPQIYFLCAIFELLIISTEAELLPTIILGFAFGNATSTQELLEGYILNSCFHFIMGSPHLSIVLGFLKGKEAR